MAEDRIWFITGASRGFGKEFAKAALERGDKVAATARDTSAVDDLVEAYGDAVLPVELDVTDRANVDAAVSQAHEHFGRLDIVVNNAGFGLAGGVEEVTDEQLEQQLDVNLFGALWVTRRVLPILREQKSGWIVQVSSIGGLAAFPGFGIYHASKWALEGVSETLAQEVADLGIKVMMVEPSGFRTDWAGNSMSRAEPIADYASVLGEFHERMQEENNGTQPGNPEKAATALIEALDSDDPPFRLLLGNRAFETAVDRYESRLEGFRKVEAIARGADD